MQDLRTEWANNWHGPVAAKPAAKPAANNVSLEELLAESDDEEPPLAMANAEGDDLENYLLAPQVDMQTDVLAWWRGRRPVFPENNRPVSVIFLKTTGWLWCIVSARAVTVGNRFNRCTGTTGCRP